MAQLKNEDELVIIKGQQIGGFLSKKQDLFPLRLLLNVKRYRLISTKPTVIYFNKIKAFLSFTNRTD